MNINELSKIMNREDFLIKIEGYCPKEFGLNNDECDQFDDCSTCREYSIKDIQFKGEGDEIIEELNTKFKVRDKIVNTDGRNFSNGKKIATITKIEKSKCGDYNLIWPDVDLGWVSEDDIKLYYKWIFNVEEWKNQDIAINCETKEETEKLFNILITNGIPKSEIDTMEYGYNSETCYNFENGKMYYGIIGYYNTKNYKVYKFLDIDFSNCWNKESIDEVALNNESKNKINYEEEYYKIQKQLDSMKDIYNVKQEQWENEQVEVIHNLKERINNYQDSILKRQDEMESLKEVAKNQENEIKQLKNEKVKLLLEIANYKTREQIIEIIKKASEML